MILSAFCLITNPIRNQYPVIESIKSVLPIVDELVVVDGWSDDGTVEAIKALQDDRIRIIKDEDTRWPEEWTYWRMGHNFSRGFNECRGDFAMKFDVDYIFDDEYEFRMDCEYAAKEVLTISFERKNFMLVDRHFTKRPKTLAVNKKLCKERKIDARWGYDLKNWGMCDEAIIYEKTKDKLLQGRLLSLESIRRVTPTQPNNYAYVFRTEEVGKDLMFRNMRAFYRQQNFKIPTKEKVWEEYIMACLKEFSGKKHTRIKLEDHPTFAKDLIKNLKPNQQGYNFWGKKVTADYYL